MPDAAVGLIDTFCAKFDLVWAIDTATISAVIVGLHESRVEIFDEGQSCFHIALPRRFELWPSMH